MNEGHFIGIMIGISIILGIILFYGLVIDIPAQQGIVGFCPQCEECSSTIEYVPVFQNPLIDEMADIINKCEDIDGSLSVGEDGSIQCLCDGCEIVKDCEQTIKEDAWICIKPLKIYNVTEGYFDVPMTVKESPFPIYPICIDGNGEVVIYDNMTLEVIPCCFENIPPEKPITIEDLQIS